MSVRYADEDWSITLRRDPCAYCGDVSGTIDHIVPLAAGGSSHWRNLTAACQKCNGDKSDIALLFYLAGVRRANNRVPGLRRRDWPDLPPPQPLRWTLGDVLLPPAYAVALVKSVVEERVDAVAAHGMR